MVVAVPEVERRTYDVIDRNAVDPIRVSADEVLPASGNDVNLITIGA